MAKATGLPQSRMSNIISGKRSITAETAIRLAKFFESTPGFWLNRQNLFDLRAAEHALGKQAEKGQSYKVTKVA